MCTYCALPLLRFLHRVMLEYIDCAVTRNASEKKINSLLDFMAQAQDIDVLQVWVRL